MLHEFILNVVFTDFVFMGKRIKKETKVSHYFIRLNITCLQLPAKAVKRYVTSISYSM